MPETTMPAAEALNLTDTDERVSYELAFHVLPTVAEGEVPAVFESIKQMISKDGGEIFDEEVAQRFDLAYEVVKHIEGKNRTFKSAYFGWVRFKAEPSVVEALVAEVEGRSDVLRSLLVRLTKEEETYPFRFHEALVNTKRVTNIDEVADDAKVVAETEEDGVATDGEVTTVKSEEEAK